MTANPPPAVERKLAGLPDQPGVYLWKDADGGVLYVGKAKRLKQRVRNYFTADFSDSPKHRLLRRLITDLDTIVRFEGDRLVSVSPSGAAVLATVSTWDAPTRLALQWEGPHSQPRDEVVVEFEAEPDRTRVTIRHQREGVTPAAVESAVLGLWWGDVLQRLTFAHRPQGVTTNR